MLKNIKKKVGVLLNETLGEVYLLAQDFIMQRHLSWWLVWIRCQDFADDGNFFQEWKMGILVQKDFLYELHKFKSGGPGFFKTGFRITSISSFSITAAGIREWIIKGINMDCEAMPSSFL